MSTEGRKTVEEVVLSLTGFDEIAIEKTFGKAPEDLNASTVARAMVYVLKRREGLDDREAYRFVMQASLKEIGEHFADTESEGNDKTSNETEPGPTS